MTNRIKVKTLRSHQQKAAEALSSAVRGIVCHPTGTGKTLIQSRSISSSIKRDNNCSVYVILSPRIMLSNQLLTDVKNDLMSSRIDCQYLSVNSGRYSDDESLRSEMNKLDDEINIPYRSIPATTSSRTIRETYKKAQRENVSLVISSTYHSVERIEQAGIPIDAVYCDEAHYLVRDDFHWIVEGFSANKMFFFTATTRETASDDGMGMNNADKYGVSLSTELPLAMINSGDMVRPRMHIVDVQTDSIEGDEADGAVIVSAFKEHDAVTNVSGKLLVVTKGSEHIERIVNSIDMQRFLRTHPSVTLFDISSEHGARVNGLNVKRSEFLKRIQTLGDNDQAIILHIDILSEGIDVPGITGIMPMNGQSRSKFLQTLGRATRLHPTDRANIWNLDSGISPNDVDDLIKPYAWIVVPAYGDLGDDLKSTIKLIVDELRSYGFNPAEDIVVKEKRGSQLPVPITACNELDDNIKEIVKYTETIVHEIEEEEEALRVSQALMDHKALSYDEKVEKLAFAI